MDAKLPKLIQGVPSNLTANYDVLEFLGEGSFAKVKKGKNKKTGQFVAIKFINKSNIVTDPRQIESLFNEINIMKSMNHPAIISLYEVYELDDKLCLVMELVTGGQLLDKIIDRGSYSERDASQLMLSIFQAIKYMHDRGIAHRDLKPQNILYENDSPLSPIKVSDFGLSKVVDEVQMMTTCCGSPYYVAPEVLSRKGYGAECDLWSLGVIMFVLLCGFPPFFDENDMKLYEKIQKGKYEFVSPYWDPISKQAKDLISRLLIVDPKKRYTVNQALQHPWFTESLPTNSLNETFNKIKEMKEKHSVLTMGSKIKK
ncbi:MAG: putative Calcium/calmodulin-dependent protein kinase type 1 [Streblomastix strix]|uniref:Putative Calcium/calmodulin-dependent protein kinase type 1 n=1 Tax=Streblomastix strix TaxID=222440 RepID=A0A5J4W9S6_9EUKA|nr:MAG: putative Calcium/calmodulin-dependent protein kinase type 1 [Streblomastix strix]